MGAPSSNEAGTESGGQTNSAGPDTDYRNYLASVPRYLGWGGGR